MAQMVSPAQMMILPTPSSKDSRWLTLEVCREFQRSKCSRTETECKFAHPPPHVEVQNGRVVACFDSIKGKCQRKDPPCKYLHPPQHLREQLLQNGRNNLILKNMQLQAYQQQLTTGVMPTLAFETGSKAVTAVPTVVPGHYSYVAAATAHHQHPSVSQAQTTVIPRHHHHHPALQQHTTTQPQQAAMVAAHAHAAAAAAAAAQSQYDASPYTGIPTLSAVAPANPASPYSHYIQSGLPAHSVAMTTNGDANSALISQALHHHSMIPTTTKAVRADKFETVSSENGEALAQNQHLMEQLGYPTYLTQAPTAATAPLPPHAMVQFTKKRPRDPTDELLLSSMPGAVPYKRFAVGELGKGGIPLYPSNHLMSTFQQPASLMQLPQHHSYIPVSFAGHPPSVPRF